VSFWQLGREVTFKGEATRGSTRVLKILVIVMIAWVAYWAATGGLDQIVIPDQESTTSFFSLL